jgi:hypothetical protein
MLTDLRAKYSAVGKATGYGWRAEESEFRRIKIFLLSMSSRPILGPIHLHIKWVPRAFSLEVKRLGREADYYSSPSSARSRMVELYSSTPPYVFMA